MKKGAKVTLSIVVPILIIAGGAWYFLFNGNDSENNSNDNSNLSEDIGYDSVIDTGDLSQIDAQSSVDEIDSIVEDYEQPDTTMNINLEP